MNAPGPNRSFLFAPGDHPRRAEKVLQVGADAAILDLEDAVASGAWGGQGRFGKAAPMPRLCTRECL
jgi:citrate lyase subunit beta/citryl-CoA lyase